jgi:hypothetical protein
VLLRGGDADRHLAEELHCGPAKTGQHQGTEGWVVAHTNDHFHAVAYLLLDQEFGGVPGDASLGQAGADRGHRVGCRLRAVDAEGDAADVALVDGCGDLDHDRPAQFRLGGRRLGRSAHQPETGGGDAVGGEKLAGSPRISPPAGLAGQHRADRCPAAARVDARGCHYVASGPGPPFRPPRDLPERGGRPARGR